jgi:TolA-binding protein
LTVFRFDRQIDAAASLLRGACGTRLARLLLGLLFLISYCNIPFAAAQGLETAEGRAFNQAMAAFTDGIFDRAERGFAQFIATFPQSPLVVEATLLQAEAALHQTNANRAIIILSAALPKAGLLQDQYRRLLGNAYLASSNYLAAAETFAAIPRTMTNSSLLLEASYGEAQARFRLGHYREVVALLREPQGVFQRSSKTRPGDKIAALGKMLLAESLFRQQQYDEATRTLEALPPEALLPEIRWERQYLLCRLMVAERRLSAALFASTNLLSQAAAAGSRDLIASSFSFQAGLLRQLGQLENAAIVYTNNLAETTPMEQRRLSFLNIIELKLAQDKIGEATGMLDAFLLRYPGDIATDIVALTRGELELKLYLNERATNGEPAETKSAGLLQAASARFDAMLATNTSGTVRGKALLNKGWCLWLDGKFAQSASAFAAAIQVLPHSEDLAVARFKLGDACIALKDYTNAIAQYRILTNDFSSVPSVRSTLFDQALYQTLHACIALQDESAATRTLTALLESYPDSTLADRSLFLVGQELMKRGKASQARERLIEFGQRFPNSPLTPEAELAVARTFVQEHRWDQAITQYEKWLDTYPTNALSSRAAFNQAWAFYKAGRTNEALQHFTNFVARFASDKRLAPMAQSWVGEHYLRTGQYREAIGSFQKILENTNWPATNHITYLARLRAGESAFAAQLWPDANGHFTALVNDDNCPPEIAAQAWFAYGDTYLSQDLPRTPAIEKYKEAKNIFTQAARYTNSPLAAAAWGKIGECYLQMASYDSKQYAEATNAFLRVMTNASANVTIRSQAEWGLAKALELYGPTVGATAAFQKAAFDHYYNILIGENLREGESPDFIWLEKAGLEAARIAESQKQWNVAIGIFQRMQMILKPARPRLDERIRRAQEQSRREDR